MTNCEVGKLALTKSFEDLFRYRQFAECAAVDGAVEDVDFAFALRVAARKAESCARIERRETRFHRLSIVTGTTAMTRPGFS